MTTRAAGNSRAHGNDSPTRNLFVAGFKHGMDDTALREMFITYGPIESAKVMLDIHTGASRGFAFVLFERLEDAVLARSAMNGRLFSLPGDAEPTNRSSADQFRLTVDFAKHDAFNVVTRSCKVYCRNIPTTMSESHIIAAIESVVGPGTVVTIAVLPDSSRSPALYDRRRGPSAAIHQHGERATANVAFIEFSSMDIAQIAVERTYRMRFEGPGSQGPLMTKYAETAEVRSERKKRHYDPPPPAQPPGGVAMPPVIYFPSATSVANPPANLPAGYFPPPPPYAGSVAMPGPPPASAAAAGAPVYLPVGVPWAIGPGPPPVFYSVAPPAMAPSPYAHGAAAPVYDSYSGQTVSPLHATDA